MKKRIDREKPNSSDEKKEILQEKYTVKELLRLGKERNEMELAERKQISDEQ